MTIEVLLPSSFRNEHRQIILAYLDRGHAFTRADWRQVVPAFDLLKNAAIMKPDMWQVIDGDTILVLLEDLADTLPEAARIDHRGIQLTVIDYAEWKDRVRARQATQGEYSS